MQNSAQLKALILCAGKGTRLQPITYSRPKHLIPVANKPILHHSIEKIVSLGIRDIGIVVSPQNHDAFFESLGEGTLWNAYFTYIEQPEILGIAHAVKMARKFLGESSFLLYLGDNLLQGNLDALQQKFLSTTMDACILLKEVADPRRFGVAELDKKGNVIKLVEKPKEPASKYAVLGIYLFTQQIHKAIEKVKPSWRGEMEITDAIQELIRMGKKVRSQVHEGWWLDTGTKEDVLQANALLLGNIIHSIAITPDDHTKITGDVEISGGTQLDTCQINGPVSIGRGCLLSHTSIGPNVSIGNDSRLEECILANSVVMENCHMQGINLQNSIVGSRVSLVAGEGCRQVHTALLGDDSTLEM